MKASVATDRATSALLGCLSLFLVASCGGDTASESAGGAPAHDPRPRDAAEHAPPAQSVTVWTEDTELFLEYAPLIAGGESAFAAHVTVIPSFEAVTSGTLSLTLTVEGAPPLTARVDQPSRPGIFRSTLSPAKAGPCRLAVAVEGRKTRDEIDGGPCTVFPSDGAARSALGDEADEPGRITFRKEQQWNTDFATVAVEERELRASVMTNGTIVPAAAKDSRVVAPAPGRVAFGAEPPILGMSVRAGDVLASFTPRLGDGDRSSLESEVDSARAEAAVAEAQLTRARGLFAEDAVPRRAVGEAEARTTTARARLRAALGRLQQYDAAFAGSAAPGSGTFELRAPIDGTLVAVEIASGQAVESGQPLFRVIDLRTVWLETRVFEPDIPEVEGARSGWFDVEGYEQRFVFDAANSRLVTVGHVVDPRSRTVPAIFSIDNRDGRLRIGQFARVSIATSASASVPAVPESALVEDAGKTVVYVQIDGEAFERRPLETGIRDAGFVEVVDGIAAGERVVSKGAYEIKLAAAAGVLPAHGHAH
jgi:RND family efflux transporter MFP subunit